MYLRSDEEIFVDGNTSQGPLELLKQGEVPELIKEDFKIQLSATAQKKMLETNMIYRYRYKSNRSAVINKVPGTNSTKRRHGCFYYFDKYIISLAFIIFFLVVNTC